MIAWVAGHSHVNDVRAVSARQAAAGFWSIRTAAEADWPQQNRLLEVMDNRDGTLSIFGTILDHASEATAPARAPAVAMSLSQLASEQRARWPTTTRRRGPVPATPPVGRAAPATATSSC